jgi:hypothetical protein
MPGRQHSGIVKFHRSILFIRRSIVFSAKSLFLCCNLDHASTWTWSSSSLNTCSNNLLNIILISFVYWRFLVLIYWIVQDNVKREKTAFDIFYVIESYENHTIKGVTHWKVTDAVSYVHRTPDPCTYLGWEIPPFLVVEQKNLGGSSGVNSGSSAELKSCQVLVCACEPLFWVALQFSVTV